jgi:hypothetical protein
METQQHNTAITQPGPMTAAPVHSGDDADSRVRSLLWFNGENADNDRLKPAETEPQLSARENYIIAVAG